MTGLAAAGRGSSWSKQALARVRAADRLGPLVVVAVVLAALVGARLVSYDGDPTGFVQFGQELSEFVDAPRSAVVRSPAGYDGQFFYMHARDPLLDDEAVTSLEMLHGEYRAQRVAYPALAYALSLGGRSALPWALLAIGVGAVLAVTALTVSFARDVGHTGWWALAVGLTPGLLLPTLRDLSDPLALAAVLGGLIAWQRDRRVAAAALLTLAVLTRETMALAVIAVAAGAAWEAWLAFRRRRRDGALTGDRPRDILLRALPVVCVPAAAFLGWQAYVTNRFSGVLPSSTTPDNQFGAPFEGIVTGIRRGVEHVAGAGGFWGVAYLAVVSVAIIAALRAAGRRPGPLSLAAAAFSLVALFSQHGSHWSYTRATAPLVALLALVGLEANDRFALGVSTSAAALTLVIPLGFGATSGA
jgi:hypothetical protein